MKIREIIKRKSNFRNYLLSLLIAIELLMSFTFLGYIHIPPISITFAYIPILIAACLLGVFPATLIGFIFGLASMYKASAFYVMPADQIFSPFFSNFPLGSLLLSVGTRTLFGFFTGICFSLARKIKGYYIWSGIFAALAPKVHSLFVYFAMGLFFPELGYTYRNAFAFHLNDFLLSLVCVLIVEVSLIIYHSKAAQQFCTYIEDTKSSMYGNKNIQSWGIFILCIIITNIISTFYFSQRIAYMLEVYGIETTENLNADLLHLQIQFLVASLALNFILLLFLLAIHKQTTYREYLSGLDELTGVMGRKPFFRYCENIPFQQTFCDGWFLFLDVDYFKLVNDTFGHPVGDHVLKEVAENLTTVFSSYGKIGRIGGDEFALILTESVTSDELKHRLDEFLTNVENISLPAGVMPDQKITCSIGVCHFDSPQDVHALISAADKLLYEAKKQGRACYVMGNME